MSLTSALYSEMASTAAITALVGTRIYASSAPYGTDFPCITFFRISEFRANPLSGIVRTDVQLDAWAFTPDSAIAIGDALYTKFHNFRGSLGDEALQVNWMAQQTRNDEAFEPMVGEDVWTHRSSIDLAIWHQETVPNT